MPARKSLSPQDAQKRVWKAEIKELQKRRRKVVRDFKSEWNRLERIRIAAAAALQKYGRRMDSALPRALNDIDRRIGICNGRIQS